MNLIKNRALILTTAAVVLVAVALTWVIAFSPAFGVRAVRVQGATGPLAAQVADAADIPNGTPLVRLNRAAIVRRVEAVPGVASAQLRTRFPSTVVLTVSERVALGYVTAGSKRYTLLDRTGDGFRTVRTKPVRLPQFVLPSGAQRRPSAVALGAVSGALPVLVRAEIVSIQALNPSAITLLLTRQRVVRWGTAQDSQQKAAVLPALLRTGATTVDLTDPDSPVTR